MVTNVTIDALRRKRVQGGDRVRWSDCSR